MKQGFYRQYRLHILFIVVFLLSFIWMGTRRTFESNSNAVEDWLPEQYQETRDYKWFLKHFPFESFIVASWEGCTLDDDRVELFAQKLVPSQTIENFSLMAPDETIQAELKLDAIPETAIDATAKDAAPETASNTVPNAVPAQADAVSEGNYFRSVMTGPRLVRLLEQSYAKTPQNRSAEEIHDEILTRLNGTLVGPDKKSTAIIITLNSGLKGGGKKVQKLIDEVKRISVECGLPDTTVVKSGSIAARLAKNVTETVHEIVHGRQPRTDALILGGPPTDNAALDQEGTRTLFRLATICAIISLIIAILCLHDFRLTMFVFWVAILAAGVALAMVSFTGGRCDSILLSMPALVYVLAMSGAIHMLNYYHDAIREHGLEGATERAVSHAFTPCFFAQLTTAIGLGSLFAGKLVPITNFGFYSAIGVLMSLLLLFFYLPALLDAFPSKKFAAKHGGKGLGDNDGIIGLFWTTFGRFIVRYHNWVALVCFLLMAFFAWNLPKIKTSVKMMNFFSSDAEIIAHYGWLEEKLGPLVPMELVVSFDNARLPSNVFGTTERLRLVDYIGQTLKAELADEVGGTLSVAMFTPDLDSTWKPGSLPYRVASSAISKTINDSRDKLRDYLTIEGNPTLPEIAETIDELLDKQRAEYRELRESLTAKMTESGADLSLLGPDRIQSNSTEEPLSPDPTLVEQSPFAAQIQELHAMEDTVLERMNMSELIRAQEKLLAENDITTLEELTERLEAGKPFRALTVDEVQTLLDSCRLWLSEKGIELWRISIRVWSLKRDIDYSAFIEDVRAVVEPILKETSDELMPEEDKLAETGSASEDFGSSHVHDIVYPAGLSAKYTGMVPLVYKTQHALILGLTNSIIMAFFLIAFIIMLILRSIAGGLVAMIPNVFPVIVVFGFMAWLGIQVDVGTMMTASVALGVAVDDTMHYLTWFSDGISRGDTPQQAAVWGYKRCATAMTQSTLIAGLGLSAFMFSTFVPTQRFGVLMLAILFMALVGDLIFLPSLLTGPAGRFFLLRHRRKMRVQKALAEEAPQVLPCSVSPQEESAEQEPNHKAV